LGKTDTLIRLTISRNRIIGYFIDEEDNLYYIDPIEDHLLDMNEESRSILKPESRIIVFRHSDIDISGIDAHCGFNKIFKERSTMQGIPRQPAITPPPAPCPALTNFRIGIAADWSYTAIFGGSARAQNQLAAIFNNINGWFVRTLRINLVVSELSLQNVPNGLSWNDGTCPDITGKLSRFSHWRGIQIPNSPANLWHLMTNCYPTGTVGLAWLGTICMRQAQRNRDGTFVSGTAVSNHMAGSLAGVVVAHEIGHNFGSAHNDGIMTANLVPSNQFSRASQNAMCSNIGVRRRFCGF